MIPLSVAKDRFGTDATLRRIARDRAYEQHYVDMYRHLMRYEYEEAQNLLELSDSDVKVFRQFTSRMEETEYPWRFVTIGLPSAGGMSSRLYRCLKKCYVGEWFFCYEEGKNGKHPHYHVLFKSNVRWLARSRIVDEWSKVFEVAKNFVDVKALHTTHVKRTKTYMKKENLYFRSWKTENETQLIFHSSTDE